MAKSFRPVLLENLAITLPRLRLHRLALHEHMPRVEWVHTHCHPHAQCLLYLRGQGVQVIESVSLPVHRGSLVFLRSNQSHGFTKERAARPVCLVVDFEGAGFDGWPACTRLREPDLGRVEQDLFRLHQLHLSGSPSPLAVGALVLDLVAVLHGVLDRGPVLGLPAGPVTQRVHRLTRDEGLATLSPASLATRLGLGLDHLNRLLRRETGTTAGRLLAQARLARATELLASTTLPVGEIGAAVGFLDQNYFARWFRRHTGQSPTQWRAGRRDAANP